jgi:hypothetical protein
MARKAPAKESVPPTLPPTRAIELLRKQLASIDDIQQRRYDDPEIKKWKLTTENILHGAFGQPNGEMHGNTRAFAHASGGSIHMNMTSGEIQHHHVTQTQNRKVAIESIIEQLELLTPPEVEAEPKTVSIEEERGPRPLDTVLYICDRFPLVIRQLAQRHQKRPTLEITDEHDVQDLLHALLRLHFDDIRPEEWTPSYGGGASRMDFLLKQEQIVVEAKMTRSGLGAREVTDQLTIDAARYRSHPDCKTLVCLVYDPGGQVKNPRGVERDLGRLSGNGLEVLCVITP